MLICIDYYGRKALDFGVSVEYRVFIPEFVALGRLSDCSNFQDQFWNRFMDFVVLHCSAQNTPLTIIDLGLHIDVDLLFEWINDGVLCDQIRYCRISRADTSVIPSLISLPVDALRLLVKNVGSTAWGENWFANLRESYGKVLECDINAAGLTGYREWLQDERLGRHTIKIAELRNRIIEDSLKAPKIFTALREEQYFIIPVLLRKLTKGFGVMRLGFRSRISYRGFF